MDLDKRRALTDFYREEFLRQLAQLELIGVVTDDNRAAVDRARRVFIDRLDVVCFRTDFPAMAEVMLQSFELLSRLAELDPRRAH